MDEGLSGVLALIVPSILDRIFLVLRVTNSNVKMVVAVIAYFIIGVVANLLTQQDARWDNPNDIMSNMLVAFLAGQAMLKNVQENTTTHRQLEKIR